MRGEVLSPAAHRRHPTGLEPCHLFGYAGITRSAWVYSSVVFERLTADQQVPGSNPGMPFIHGHLTPGAVAVGTYKRTEVEFAASHLDDVVMWCDVRWRSMVTAW